MIRILLILALAMASGHALAEKKLYRCGNQYQERPCEGPKPKQVESETPVDPQKKKQDEIAKREERDRALQQTNCKVYKEELADVQKRIKAGASSKKVAEDLEKRRSELELRIGKNCT